MKDEVESRGYARCKACDNRFYPRWIAKAGVFEDMCHFCLNISMVAAHVKSDHSDEHDYAYLTEQQEGAVTDSLYELDESLEVLDESTFSGLSLFDKH